MKKNIFYVITLLMPFAFLYSQNSFRLDKKNNLFYYNSDSINFVRLNHNAIETEKRDYFFNWFFRQNPKNNFTDFCYLFDYFPYDSSLKVYYQKEFYNKIKDSNWTEFTNLYKRKILFMNKENEKQFEIEKNYLKNSLSNKNIPQSDIELIIFYDLKEYKDQLKKQYFQLEREYNKRRINNEDIWIEPIHIALAKFGDKDVEELIYQRINTKKAYTSLPNILKNINTKKSLLKVVEICEVAINEDKGYLEKNFENYKAMDEKFKKDKNYISKCGNNYFEPSYKSNEVIANFEVPNIDVKNIIDKDKILYKYKDIQYIGIQTNINSIAKLMVIKELILKDIKNIK